MYKIEWLMLLLLILPMIHLQDLYAQISPLQVTRSLGYMSNSGYYVIGDLQNNGGAARLIDIKVEFYNRNRTLLATLPATLALDILPIGGISPFTVTLSDPVMSKQVSSYRIIVGDYHLVEEKPRKLDVVFSEMKKGDNKVVINGRVSNDSTSVSTSTKVTVVLYNTIGEPLIMKSLLVDPKDVLPAGSGIFSTEFDINANDVGGYVIYAESTQYIQVKRFEKLDNILQLTRLKELVILNDFTLLNQEMSTTKGGRVGEPLIFSVDLTNNADVRQEFTYILQIKNEEGFVIYLSTFIGDMDVDKGGKFSIAWLPNESGIYTAEAFVWQSIDSAVPLSFSTLNIKFSVS